MNVRQTDEFVADVERPFDDVPCMDTATFPTVCSNRRANDEKGRPKAALKKMRTSLLTLAVVLLSACAAGAAAPVNLVADPGFEEQPVAGRGGWVGTQNAGQAVFERSAERPRSGRWAAKLACRDGDVYARWVYRTPDLFATVKRGDRLKLSFWYRASAALGDALVQISHDAAPGWEQYPLKRLQATDDAWVLYEAVFTVAVNPTGGGEVQLRGSTDRTGDQVVFFDDVSLEVAGHDSPRRDAVVLGDPSLGVTGVYHPEGRITFEGQPAKEWEFMATGTGLTGLTVSCPAELIMQVNQASAIDEGGRLRALARLHLDLEGRPFANARHFRMEHDLRKSVITALADTAEGPVKVEIRAHVPLDLLRIDVDDGRKSPGRLTVRLEEDAPSKEESSPELGLQLGHENPVPEPAKEEASGVECEGTIYRGLGGRAFGLAVFSLTNQGAASGGTLAWPGARRHTFYVAGASVPGGREALGQALAQARARVRAEGGERFLRTHEAWWQNFWQRSRVVVHDPTGRMLRCQAAFDLYRYYLACCASERRETPVRFQIDLFRYHTRFNDWMVGLICAVEQYQSFYGALRAGDWEPLRGLGSFYEHHLPQYQDFAQRVYGHAGARIPMWSKAPVLRPAASVPTDAAPKGVANVAYNGENPAGALWVLGLLSDYVTLSGDVAHADKMLLPLATALVEFVRLQYPQRENGRMVIAPCNAGETWQGVRNPAEMVCALRHALPRLIALGRTRGWKRELLEQWERMLASVPDIPLGKFQYAGPEVKPRILPGDQLVPAADMSACQAYTLPWSGGKPRYELNGQQTEMYAVWPARLVLRNPVSRDQALRSYRDRLWKNKRDGWNLDVVFAACLGLREEVAPWHDRHFDWTFVLPCGLARETAQNNPAAPSLPECPSLQGMGTGVIPVLEMLLQDYPDELIVLPCWPDDVPVDFTLYSPSAGRVEVHYGPTRLLRVATQRQIRVRPGVRGPTQLQVERLPATGAPGA